tara:strand:- start:2217 stop:2972 length:756 start_codon:yes stop_codon:yes gene_type:complete
MTEHNQHRPEIVPSEESMSPFDQIKASPGIPMDQPPYAEIPDEHKVILLENDVRKRVEHTSALESSLNAANERVQQLEYALQISGANAQRTEAKLAKVTAQRDLFMDREIDEGAEREIERQHHEAENKRLAEHMSQMEQQFTPVRAKLHQSESALQEVRGKFATVKHNEKQLQEHNYDLQDELGEQRQAFMWYLEVTRAVKYSVLHRFQKATGTALRIEHIVRAYKERNKTRRVPSQFNIVDCLVEASRKS